MGEHQKIKSSYDYKSGIILSSHYNTNVVDFGNKVFKVSV